MGECAISRVACNLVGTRMETADEHEGQKGNPNLDKLAPKIFENDNTLGLTYGPSAELKAGQIVAEKYKVIGELGRGGMGVVYRVEQLTLGRMLAMKTLNTQEVSDITWRRFQLEAKAAALLDHPNLITVHDCGLINNEIPFFIMDYIEGTTLSNLIKDKGALSFEECLTIFIQVCFGLAYAHAVGVIHRDLKPSNIMLVPPQADSNGLSVKVVDFGIAKLTAEEIQPTQALTRTGEIFGSPLYMSPEQCLGKPVDHRSDIYSLGCVLFEALTGVPPFMGSTALSTMMQHQSNDAPSLKEATLGKEFPESIEKILRLMLEKNPESRYQDMKTVARDLSLLQQGISHHPLLTTETKAEEQARTNKKHLMHVAAAFLLGAAVSGAGVCSMMKLDAASAYREGYQAHKAEKQKEQASTFMPMKQSESESETIDDNSALSSLITGADGKTYRRFNFQKGYGIGYIYLLDKDKAVPAKLTQTFPIDEPLRLDVEDKLIVTSPNFLLRFNANEWTGMRFRYNFGVGDSTFKFLDRQKSLKSLDVTGCDVGPALIEQLNKLPLLESLKVSKTNLLGQDVVKLKRLRELKTLSIAKIAGQGEVLRKLKNSENLQELRISADLISKQDLRLLATMKNIDNLWIEKSNNIGDEDLVWLANLHELREFCPVDSKITPKVATIVRGMPKLRIMAVNAKIWSKLDIARFQKEFPKVSLAFSDKAVD